MTEHQNNDLVTQVSVRDYFQHAMQTAVTRQKLQVSDESIIYVTNMLTEFVRTEHLYATTPDGPALKPLALFYSEALNAHTAGDRDNALKKLGDVALFIAGLFAGSLSRSLVDIDYYIAMGGNAFSYLADSSRVSRTNTALREAFIDLASQFSGFVDILAEISDQTHAESNLDILRCYEIWLCSGSKHAAKKLGQAGIQPIRTQRLIH
jgi:hypothetical protein